MKNERNQNYFSESFFEFISDLDDLTQEELRAELVNLGVDTDKLEKRIVDIVRRCSAERRLAWLGKAKKRREEIGQKLEAVQTSGINTKKDLKSRIKEILEGGHGQAAFSYAEAYFRKIERLSEKDLESLIDDMERLNLLEELNNKDE